jgi:hypothetical protein
MIRWLLLALIALAGLAAPAHAHLMPNSVISLDFHKSAVEAEILMPMSELAYGSGHRLTLSPAHGVGTEAGFIAGYVRKHLQVQAPDGRAWTVAVSAIDISADSWNTDIRAIVTLTPPPGASTRRFTLWWDGIIDRVSNHFVLVFVRSDFAMGTMASVPEMLGGLQGSTHRLTVDRGVGNSWLGFLASLRLGMEHIAEGHDHLLFLMALILPAPLIARGGRWTEYGGWRRTLGGLAMIVSAFTVGHSLTLIGGAVFNWQLPARPVEVGIALSILVSAIHAWRPLFAGREAVVAAGFGLVHGLAFATVISNFNLDPLAKAQSILGFNLGIEMVQMAVIVSVLPLLLLIAPTRWYPAIRTGGALFAGFAALAWIEERVSGQPNGIGDAVDALLGQAPWIIGGATVVALLLRCAGRGLLPLAGRREVRL